MSIPDFSLFETKPSWHDFMTDDWSTEEPVTDEVAKRYIPQDKTVQMLYDCHRGLGEDITHALIKTLEAYCGVPSWREDNELFAWIALLGLG